MSSETLGSEVAPPEGGLRLLFMGRKRSGAAALEWSLRAGMTVAGVVTDPHGAARSPVRLVAERHGLPIYGEAEAYSLIANESLRFDVGISFVHPRRLRAPLLDHPRYGFINFHPAPLPDYKGLGGYNLAILDRLSAWAVTAHYVDLGIDTGAIIDRFVFSIDAESETARSLERKSHAFLLALYRKTLRRVQEMGRLATNVNAGGRYVSRREMEALKQIVPGDDVDRKIRAFWFPPYPGAQIAIAGRSYTLVNDDILRELAVLYDMLGEREDLL